MSGPRDIVHDKPEIELKVASRRLIRAAGGTDGAGETIGVRQQKMSDFGLPNTADFLRIDQIGALEDVSAGKPGHPHVTRALAKRQGFELVKVPDAPAIDAQLLRLMAEKAKEHGDAMAAICNGLADGKLDATEAAKALEEIETELQLTLCVRATLQAIVNEGGAQ